jgi:hypothetical protein
MANGRIATVVFSNVSISAAQDAFEITPADDKPIELVGVCFAQRGVADVGDAQEEMLGWTVIRGHTTSGSGGSAATPRPVKRSDAVSFTAEVNNTTVASAGTGVTLHEDAFNVRAGLTFWWPEGTEPETSQGDTTIVVRFPAPADAITISGTLYVRELG